jgi:hypothetical protein
MKGVVNQKTGCEHTVGGIVTALSTGYFVTVTETKIIISITSLPLQSRKISLSVTLLPLRGA